MMEGATRGALLCCLLLSLLPANTVQQGAKDDGKIVVKIQCGELCGKLVKVKETQRQVHAFYGIPFAKPPVGRLRFAAPEAPEPWKGVRDGTQQPSMCIQDPAFQTILYQLFANSLIVYPPMSEDCLYLNVFTPADCTPDTKLPVMVFIHGGNFVLGGAVLYDGSALCARENVIVVVIQYRLGVLGCFTSGDSRAPGNYGLLDQVEALRWVQGNIEHFGGDPKCVTIFGESSGGISVSLLVLSPMAKGLFHRAIVQSGVAIVNGMMAWTPEEIAYFRKTLIAASGCEERVLLECLKGKSEADLMAVAVALYLLPLPVTVDGKFLPKPAEEILKTKAMNRVPLLAGVVQQESGYVIPLVFRVPGLLEGMSRKNATCLLRSFPLLKVPEDTIQPLLKEYIGNAMDPFEIRNRFLELCGDNLIAIPTLKTVKYHRDAGLPVYLYQFCRRPDHFKLIKPAFVKADHGDDLFFTFGAPYLQAGVLFAGPMQEGEKKLCNNIMKYLANFARSGNPNGPNLTNWPRYDQKEAYLKLNLKQTLGYNLNDKRYHFWTETLPEMQKKRNGYRP